MTYRGPVAEHASGPVSGRRTSYLNVSFSSLAPVLAAEYEKYVQLVHSPIVSFSSLAPVLAAE